MKETGKKETVTEKATKPTTVKKESAKKEVVKKVAVKKEAVKKEGVKKDAVKKETVKKTPVKKDPKKETVSLNSTIQFELGGKTYSETELMNSVKDIWVYDYMRDLSELKTVELYIKPEENKAYYVINGDILGSFCI